MGVSLWHKIFGLPEQQSERIAEISSSEIEESVEFVEREEFREERLREESPRATRPAELMTRITISTRTRSLGMPKPSRLARPKAATRKKAAAKARSRAMNRAAVVVAVAGDADVVADALTKRAGEERPPSAAENGTEEAREPREPREQREPREPRGRGRGRSGGSGRSRREDSRRSAPKDDFDDDGLEEIILDDPEDEAVDSRMSDEDGDDFLEDGERSTSSGHKSIPSWDEAIGMIVDTNLATRTDRRRSSAPPSRGNGLVAADVRVAVDDARNLLELAFARVDRMHRVALRAIAAVQLLENFSPCFDAVARRVIFGIATHCWQNELAVGPEHVGDSPRIRQDRAKSMLPSSRIEPILKVTEEVRLANRESRSSGCLGRHATTLPHRSLPTSPRCVQSGTR